MEGSEEEEIGLAGNKGAVYKGLGEGIYTMIDLVDAIERVSNLSRFFGRLTPLSFLSYVAALVTIGFVWYWGIIIDWKIIHWTAAYEPNRFILMPTHFMHGGVLPALFSLILVLGAFGGTCQFLVALFYVCFVGDREPWWERFWNKYVNPI